MGMVRVTAVLLGVFVAAAGAFAPAAAAQTSTTTTTAPGGIGGSGLVVRLAEVPSDRKDDPRANQYIVDHVAPGERLQRKVALKNDTSDPMQVKLYLGGARVEDGAFLPDDATASELEAWGSVAPASVDLAPGEGRDVQVTLDVPTDAKAGERYGAVWAELPPAVAGGGVTQVNRVGIRIYLSVSGGAEPETRFALPRFTATRDTDGRPGVDIAACNEGERAIDLSGSLELNDGPGGTSDGPFDTPSPATTLAPDQCADVAIRLSPDIPTGPWTATVTLRSGTVEETATATITFPEDPGTAAPPVVARPKDVTGTAGGRIALVIALLLLLLVLALLLWWLWRRKQRRGEAGDEDRMDSPGSSLLTSDPGRRP